MNKKLQRFIYNLKIFHQLFKAYWQRHIIYRLSALIWIVNGMITPFILMSVWLTIREHNQLPMDDKQIITYYILSIFIFRLTQSWRAEGLGQLINDGGFSIYMIRPFSFFIQELARDLSMKAIRIISLVPFLFLIIFIFQDKMILSYNFVSILIFSFSIILGYIINFLLGMTVGLLAFWLEHAYGASMTIDIVSHLFNGTLFPLVFMPELLKKLMIILPFRYIVSFPIEVLTNSLEQLQILKGFVILGIWIFLIYLLLVFTFSKGIKKYTAVGI